MRNFIRKHPFVVILVCILATVLLTGFVSLQTNNFENPEDLFTLARNEANLLIPGEGGNYTLLKDKNTESGLVVDLKSNGAIQITGSNPMATTDEISVAELTLKKGTYTLSTGAKTSTSTVYVTAMAGGSELVKADFGDEPGTFTLEADTTVEIVINVCAGNNHNITLYPVLVADDEPGAFYAIQA